MGFAYLFQTNIWKAIPWTNMEPIQVRGPWTKWEDQLEQKEMQSFYLNSFIDPQG